MLNVDISITVITVVYNGAKTLDRALQSVAEQSYDSVQHVVIDGGSTDESVDIIRRRQSQLDYWISERDEGIYDAMNKGIEQALGRYILFLNSDDQLFSIDTLEKVAAKIAEDKNDRALYFGDVIYRLGKPFVSRMSAKMFFVNTVHHQGAFYNRDLFADFKYNRIRKVSADYELNLIIYLRGLSCLKLDQVISVCDEMGVSQTSSEFSVNFENHLVRMDHVGALRSIFGLAVALANSGRRALWPNNG